MFTNLHTNELRQLLDDLDGFLLVGFKDGKSITSWYLPNELVQHAIKSRINDLAEEASVSVQIMLENPDEPD